MVVVEVVVEAVVVVVGLGLLLKRDEGAGSQGHPKVRVRESEIAHCDA